MKVKLTLIVVLIWGGSSFVSVCNAAQGPYLGVNGGVVSVNDIDLSGAEFRSDEGFDIGIVGGYDFGLFRMEGELSYRKNNVDEIEIDYWGNGSMNGDGDITSTSLLVNGYFDMENNTGFTPYVGLGLGIANIAFNNVSALGIDLIDDDTTKTAAQLALGFSYDVTDKVVIDFSYRYFFTDDIRVKNEFNNEVHGESYDSHNAVVGLRAFF